MIQPQILDLMTPEYHTLSILSPPNYLYPAFNYNTAFKKKKNEASQGLMCKNIMERVIKSPPPARGCAHASVIHTSPTPIDSSTLRGNTQKDELRLNLSKVKQKTNIQIIDQSQQLNSKGIQKNPTVLSGKDSEE